MTWTENRSEILEAYIWKIGNVYWSENGAKIAVPISDPISGSNFFAHPSAAEWAQNLDPKI